MNNQSPIIFGTGSEFFDFVNVKDCARANILAMKSKIENDFFNIGSGKKTSLNTLANLLMNIHKKKLKILIKKTLTRL